MIVGLTDRTEASFPRIGVMHKGEPAPKRADGRTERPGKDTNYFRLDSKFPDVMEAFRQAYGDKPQLLNVVLPHPTPEENFQTCKEHWVAGGLVHRCDGETTSRFRMPDGSISKEPRPCPGQCRQVGRMMIIIPEILEQTLRLAYITIQTTANNDLPRLMEELYAIYNIRGTLQGVPMVLRRVEEQISVPRSQTDPTRVRRSKWMLHIEAAPKFAKALLQSIQQEAIEAPTRRALGAQPRQLNAAPVHGQLDTSKVAGAQHEEPESVATDFDDDPIEFEDDQVTCISGDVLKTATAQYQTLKAKGRNGAKFNEWLRKNFDAETIDTVAESDGERLIESLTKILAQISSEETKAAEASKPEEPPTDAPSEDRSALIDTVEAAKDTLTAKEIKDALEVHGGKTVEKVPEEKCADAARYIREKANKKRFA